MALGTLAILLIGITAISGLSIAFLFLTKNKKIKNILFYFVSIWNLLVTYISATSLPTNFTAQKLICWVFGLLSIIAICIHIKNKDPKTQLTANILTSVALAASVLKLLFF